MHKLLAYITDMTIQWLKARADAIGESVAGMFILDDIPGFLSRKHYLEFVHPYLKQIFDSSPKDWVKVYHNDATIDPFLEDLADAGFDVLNWTFKLEPEEVRKRTAGKIALMGTVPPLDIGVRGTPENMKTAVLDLPQKVERKGTIFSLGGGVSPGMPGANIAAMADAVREFNSQAKS